MKSKQIDYLLIVAPFVIGSGVYVFLREGSIISLNWNINPKYMMAAPDWLKYNLVDGLWMLSLLSLINFIWRSRLCKDLIIWQIIVLITAFSLETLQRFEFIPGYFDWKDIGFYFLASGISMSIIFLKNFKLTFNPKKLKHEIN